MLWYCQLLLHLLVHTKPGPSLFPMTAFELHYLMVIESVVALLLVSEWIITEPIQWWVSWNPFSYLLLLLLFPLPRLAMLQNHRGIGLAYHLSTHPRDRSFLIKVLIYCQVSLWLLLFLVILWDAERGKGRSLSLLPPKHYYFRHWWWSQVKWWYGRGKKGNLHSNPCKLLACKLPRIIITRCPYLSRANDCDI